MIGLHSDYTRSDLDGMRPLAVPSIESSYLAVFLGHILMGARMEGGLEASRPPYLLQPHSMSGTSPVHVMGQETDSIARPM
jgi:hypothetical protein